MEKSHSSLFCVWTRLKSASSAELVSCSLTALKFLRFPTVLTNGMSVSYSQYTSIPRGTTRVPGYRPNWALVPVIIIEPEACRKLQGAAFWVPYISDPWVKTSCSLWNCFCNLYRKQKFREHKTSAIFITLWSFKIPVNLVYYSRIAILTVCTVYFLLLSLKNHFSVLT